MNDSVNITKLTDFIRSEAMRLGFLECGFAKVRELTEVKESYDKWISSGFHASMGYMDRNAEKRLNPGLLVENSKSVISLLYNYYADDAFKEAPYRISRYAYGMDYHQVIKDKLKQLEEIIRNRSGAMESRCFVDSAPVFERKWAQQSGLGWIGKNTCLLSRRHGSFFFIAEIITSLELSYNEPHNDYCGSCQKCIDACPTNAITADRFIDSNKCISYHTIENRDEIPTSLKGKFNKYIFGCDICQDVCPWNKKSIVHNEPLFSLPDQVRNLSILDWRNMDTTKFKVIFKNSAIKRTKFEGLKRNIFFQNEDLNNLCV